jgi:hypothetical protein
MNIIGAHFRGRRPAAPEPDMWEGKALPERGTVLEDIHFRIYHGRTGELLSFGTSNVLQVVAEEFAQTKAAHPDTWLRIVSVDGPSY